MSTILVFGSIRLANGQPCGVFKDDKGTGSRGSDGFEYRIIAHGTHVVVEFSKWPPSFVTNVEEVFITSRRLLDTILLGHVLLEGGGIRYEFERCVLPDNTLRPAPIVELPPSSFPLSAEEISRVIGGRPQLRWALRDFNDALYDRDNCGHLFYRAVEAAAKGLLGVDELKSAEWEEMHRRLGTTRAQLDQLKTSRDQQAHGTRSWVTDREFEEAMRTAHAFLLKIIGAVASQKEAG